MASCQCKWCMILYILNDAACKWPLALCCFNKLKLKLNASTVAHFPQVQITLLQLGP